MKDVQKKAKPHSLMQEVTTFLTSHYHFCFNVLTEVTEVACLENAAASSTPARMR